MTKAQKTTKQAQNAEYMRELLKPGDTLYTVLRSRAASGMSRCIDVYVIRENEPLRITFQIAMAVDYVYDRNKEALRVSGCGMDAGFEVVYNLGRVLFPQGFAVVNEDGTPKRGRNDDMSGWDNDGGYALNQRWM